MSWPRRIDSGRSARILRRRVIHGLGEVEHLWLDARIPGERRGHGSEDILGHSSRVGSRGGKGDLDATFDVGRQFGFDGGHPGGAVRGDHLRAHSDQRIEPDKFLAFPGPEIVAGIVSGVAPQAQGVRLDEHGPAGRTDLGDHLRQRPGAAGDIGRVDLPAFHPIAGGPPPEFRPAAELLRHRRGIGVTIVLHHENDRQREQGGEIEGFVDVAGAGSAVAENRKADGPPPQPAL